MSFTRSSEAYDPYGVDDGRLCLSEKCIHFSDKYRLAQCPKFVYKYRTCPTSNNSSWTVSGKADLDECGHLSTSLTSATGTPLTRLSSAWHEPATCVGLTAACTTFSGSTRSRRSQRFRTTARSLMRSLAVIRSACWWMA